ncbi:hypothetical protein [Polaromonas sp. YR568]|uniref:hypothetical protein n=1 Tax=Polaromonas sp. YR568 TaxID=1855301 RepID=UPI003137F5CC
MKPMPLSCAVCGLVLSTLAATVAAQTPLPPPSGGAAASSASSAGFDQPVDLATLDSQRGGSQFVLVHNDMTLTGSTAGNMAEQVNTGSNAISAGAFANMNGIPVVIQNSGANVLIQNAVILNLQMN